MGGLQFIGPNYTFLWRPDPRGLTCNCTGIEKTVSLETEDYLSANPSISRSKVVEILDGEQGHWKQSSDTYNFVKIENLTSVNERWKKMKAVDL